MSGGQRDSDPSAERMPYDYGGTLEFTENWKDRFGVLGRPPSLGWSRRCAEAWKVKGDGLNTIERPAEIVVVPAPSVEREDERGPAAEAFPEQPARSEGLQHAAVCAQAFSRACMKSSTRSSGSSPPMETRNRPSPMPAASRSSAESWRWLVVPG